MSKILVISGHPNLKESYANTLILDELQSSFDDLTIRYLDKLYSNYQIDVEAEQAALQDANVIVLQFPFYWYSVPALLKKWIDDVMSFNFAYGPQGDKLKNKTFILSFTIGGSKSSYTSDGYNHFSIEQLIFPLQQMAQLAGMKFQDPVYTHEMIYIPDIYNELSEVQARAKEHAKQLVDKINYLTDPTVDLIKAFVTQWFQSIDTQQNDDTYFTAHLAQYFQMTIAQEKFEGLSGFSNWHQNFKKTFKPYCTHQIHKLDIKPSEIGYQLELRVCLFAQSYLDSYLRGHPVELYTDEIWQISNHKGKTLIHEMTITPLNEYIISDTPFMLDSHS